MRSTAVCISLFSAVPGEFAPSADFMALPNDVLARIFRYIESFEDLLSFELVCQQWRCAVFDRRYSRITHLSLIPSDQAKSGAIPGCIFVNISDQGQVSFAKRVIMPRIVNFIEHLSIAVYDDSHWTAILRLVCGLWKLRVLECKMREPANFGHWDLWMQNLMETGRSSLEIPDIELELTLISPVKLALISDLLRPLGQLKLTKLKLINGIVSDRPLKLEDDFLKVVFQAPELEVLKFREFEFVISHSDKEIFCPHLESLRLSCCILNRIDGIFECMKAPKLKEVEFYNSKVDANVKTAIMSAFMDKANFPVLETVDFQ